MSSHGRFLLTREGACFQSSAYWALVRELGRRSFHFVNFWSADFLFFEPESLSYWTGASKKPEPEPNLFGIRLVIFGGNMFK